MKLSSFKFTLPEEKIAKYPVAYRYNDKGEIEVKEEGFDAYRDESRLMILHKKSKTIEHKLFKELVDYFDEGDLMIYNNTKVYPAFMIGNKDRTSLIEVYLLRELDPETKLWDVLVDPARKIRVGNKLYFGEDNSMVAEVIDNTTSRGRTVRFLYDGDHDVFKRELFALGSTLLPMHIKRRPEPEDAERFQTIYASKEGAIIAPAAGLHFSREMLKRFEIKGVERADLTLHCSLGMFKKIEVEDLSKHKVASESMDVDVVCAKKFNEANAAGKKICAVGTCTLRALETASTFNGNIEPYGGWTNRFIFPDYVFITANCLISNFQEPVSVMLMNQAAFGGFDFVMDAYKLALEMDYRFGFYGDSLMILPD